MSYFRRGYRSFGYRPRFGYGRGYNRYWRRRGWYRRRGTNRAQTAGNRRFKLTVPCNDLYSVTIAGGARRSGVHAISPFCTNVGNNLPHHCLGSAFLNASFISYCNLYDEVKVDWVSVTLECMENIGANVNSVIVYTGIDRRSSYAELNSTGAPFPSITDLIGSSSCVMSYMNSTAKRSVRRFFSASDLIERNQFVDTDFTNQNGVFLNTAFFGAGANPNFWCPSVLFGVELSGNAPAGGYTVPFAYNIKWGFTFRGPKYASQAASSKSVEIESGGDVSVEPVKISGAGKVVDEKPLFSGLLGGAFERLSENISENVPEYECGAYDVNEDVKFVYEKVGKETFHKLFGSDYDRELVKLGLEKKEVMDDDPTELVMDSKS